MGEAVTHLNMTIETPFTKHAALAGPFNTGLPRKSDRNPLTPTVIVRAPTQKVFDLYHILGSLEGLFIYWLLVCRMKIINCRIKIDCVAVTK